MIDGNYRGRKVLIHEQRHGDGALRPGAVAGDYVVTELIAEGGGGSVYGATHRKTGRPAALKVLHESLVTVPKMVERFEREVEVLNLLRHPGIVQVWAVGALPDKRPFFAMERVTGKTLAALLEEVGRLTPEEAFEIFVPVCDALAAAHSAGIIHRDVKPTNIIIMEGAPHRVKLLDFGIAKLIGEAHVKGSNLTSEGRQIGTPTCMSPEQILGGKVDERVDIYALGVLLYRMLTGRPPFITTSALAQMRLHLEQPVSRPSLRAPAAAPLDAIVLRCMQKDPELRFRSVEELLSALQATASGGALQDVSGTAELAAAVHVAVRVSKDLDDMDGWLADSVGGMLDVSEDALCDADMLIGLATGDEVLGVRLLPSDSQATERELLQVISVAAALRELLDRCERGDGRARATVCVHVGSIMLRSGDALEVAGGELLCADMWAPHAHNGAVGVTPAVARRLDLAKLPETVARLVALMPVDPEATLPRESIAPQAQAKCGDN